MGAAPAKIAGQSLLDLRIGGFGSFIEQCLGRHDHAVDAVAALRGLLIDEGLLNLVQFLGRAQTFQRGDRLILDCADRRDTGANGVAVHNHRASAALRHAAAELRAVEFQVVAQDIEQGNIGFRIDHSCFAVYSK